MTVQQLLGNITSVEITYWRALFRIKADEWELEKQQRGGGGKAGSPPVFD